MLTCSNVSRTNGGGASYAKFMQKALQRNNFDAELFDKSTDIKKPDVIFLTSIGMNGESSKGGEIKNRDRLLSISKWFGKVPFILTVHDVTEKNTFKNSFKFFKDFEFDAIILIENTKKFREYVDDNFNYKKLYTIRHPFEFNDKNFKNRINEQNRIISTARIASTKRTGLLLDISKNISELKSRKQITIAGKESGIYWYHSIKDHPNREFANFIGSYDSYWNVMNNFSFAIDLTLFRSSCKNKYISGGRTQYTILEAIDCGLIPIGFDIWRWDEGYNGIWLNTPDLKKNKITFDPQEYAEVINDAKYCFDVALDNREKMKKISDLKIIGREIEKVIKDII